MSRKMTETQRWVAEHPDEVETFKRHYSEMTGTPMDKIRVTTTWRTPWWTRRRQVMAIFLTLLALSLLMAFLSDREPSSPSSNRMVQTPSSWTWHAVPSLPSPSPSAKSSPSPRAHVVARKHVASRSRSTATRTWTTETGVVMPAVMRRVRECESGGDYSLTNNHSTASGGWQFLDSTWHYVTGLPGRAKNYSRLVQDQAALKLYRSEGLAPWASSRRCWAA